MPLFESFLFLAVAALAGFWWDSLQAREQGIREAREVCANEGLQLLDDTVSGSVMRLLRDEHGVLRLARTYLFEFSDNGNNRRTGRIVLHGRDVVLISLGKPRLASVGEAPAACPVNMAAEFPRAPDLSSRGGCCGSAPTGCRSGKR